MELLEFIRAQVGSVHQNLGLSMEDLTDEIAHIRAGGTTNTIAQILAHMVTGQDLLISEKLRGLPTLHESGWAAKTGVPANRIDIWQDHGWRLNLEAFNAFRLAVQANSTSFVDALQPAELDLPRTWIRGPERPLGMLLQTIFINHALGHCGEISALKGVQGLKGLPI